MSRISKHLYLKVGVPVTMTTLLLSGVAGATAAPQLEEDQAAAVLQVEDGLGFSPTQMQMALDRHGLVIEEVRFLYPGEHGHTLTVGVPSLDGRVPKDARAQVEMTLSDLAIAQKGATEGKSQGHGAPLNPTPNLISLATTELSRHGALIDQVVVKSLRETALPSGLTVVAPSYETEGAAETAPLESTAAASCGRWHPTLHWISSGSSASGGRFHSFDFFFTSAQLAAFKCTGSWTFEPDFVTNNYDGRHYFGQSMQSWAATMPNAYWDTNAFDGSSERVYTVGSQNIDKFTTAMYNIYVRMDNGNWSSDTAKMVWQRGVYSPGCLLGPAWCIFANESVIQYAWTIPVPGTYYP